MPNASFNIDDFMKAYGNYARGYLFYASIQRAPVPIPEDHPYLVRTSALPASTLEVAEANWQGHTFKIGTVQTFDTIDIEFSADPEQNLRQRFLDWMNIIHNPETNVHGAPTEVGGNVPVGGVPYFGRVVLEHLGESGQTIMKYGLVGAFPSTVGELTLDYSARDVAVFTVTFTYQHHVTGPAVRGINQ